MSIRRVVELLVCAIVNEIVFINLLICCRVLLKLVFWDNKDSTTYFNSSIGVLSKSKIVYATLQPVLFGVY
jgi:hypothetical protein